MHQRAAAPPRLSDLRPPPVVAGGRRRGARAVLGLMGPAFVAAIAYVDPGNFATNLTAGSRLGYSLAWVVVVSNLMAMLLQYLSAKLGIATGTHLARLCRDRYPRSVSRLLWAQAELVVMATDLAEVLGGALALQLLFGVPLLAGGTLTAVVAFAVLTLHRGRSRRPFEAVIATLLGVILVGFFYALVRAGVDGGALLRGTVPQLSGPPAVLLAAGILGATVMPHALYLHSGLTGGTARTTALRRTALRAQRWDVVAAMSVAGLVNLAMLTVGASALGGTGIDSIEGAHAGFAQVLGPAAALLFTLALLASGVAASSVGTCSGQLVMEGLLGRRVPSALCRLATLAPSLVVLAVGVDPTRALVLSQVVLSFGIPFALVPLVLMTRDRSLMGALVNRPLTTAVAWTCAGVVVVLNAALLWLTLAG